MGEPAARRGRPRDEAIDRRVKAVAMDLLSRHGFAAVSVNAICEGADIPRSSFYRRWPDTTALLADAFDLAATIDPLPDTGVLADDVVAFAQRLTGAFAQPMAAACLAYLMAEAQVRPELRARLLRDQQARRAQNQRIFERAQQRGERLPDISADLVFDTVNGMLFVASHKSPARRADEVERIVRKLLS